jgi:hypothetical protein
MGSYCDVWWECGPGAYTPPSLVREKREELPEYDGASVPALHTQKLSLLREALSYVCRFSVS